MRFTAAVILVFCSFRIAFSQELAPDTTLVLKDVNIVSDRLVRFAKGQNVLTLDTMSRKENPGGTLAELIPGFTSTYVRSYGQGTLATLSIRGTSANHAGLLWNGIRLSPPNIGYVDLSLIQGNFFQEVSVLYGGASPMFGSGLIGGGIHLNNRPVFDTAGWNGHIGISGGSYGSLMTEGGFNYSTSRFYSHTAYSIGGSHNDFIYKDLEGDKSHMEHGAYFKSGFLQDFAISLAKNQYIMASTWFQYAGREIPATLTEGQSNAEQLDRSWRSMLIWKRFGTKTALEAKTAYFNEFTRYADPNSDVYSVIHSQTGAGTFEATCNIFTHSTLFAGANYTYEYADLDYYESPEHQQSLSLYASWQQVWDDAGWQLSLNARQEVLSGYTSPFLYSVGAEGHIWRIVSGRVSFSRNFRAPTLNERYWQPGGNPDLDPEKSYNLEAGISVKPVIGDVETGLDITGFSSWVDNWILWLPGTGYWSVENAQKVWSRGIETALNASTMAGQCRIYLSGSYTLTFSTNEKKLSEYDDSYRKQLIYTPVHRFLFKPGIAWHGFTFTLRGNYTGVVYTTKDNEDYLPGYFLLDGIFSKTLHIKGKFPVSLQVNLNNITNKRYEAVPYRPMPGIGVMVTVVFEVGGSLYYVY